MMKTISLIRAVSLAFLAGCSAIPESGTRTDDIAKVEQMGDADKLYIVDCLLPGQIRSLGSMVTYITERRPIKTTALDCEIRGGEYVAYDRANYATSLKIWLPKAQSGDPEAQTYTGEIYEKGLGTQPDYKIAADWYRKASAQGNSRAQINLGHLYEKGLGVEKNLSTAMEWYRKASGLEKKDLPFAPTIATSSAPSNITQNPVIEIIDPPLMMQRGSMPTVTLRSLVKEREIIGRADSPAGITSVMVNDNKNTLDHGIFKATVGIKGEKTLVKVVAKDKNGALASLEFLMLLENSATSNPAVQGSRPSYSENLWKNIDFGNYYALIIGNAHYKKKDIASLDTPINDAKAVDKVLREKYGFKTTVLIDADRYQILSAMNDLRIKLTENDNFLIYYAGHGELDEANTRGQWLPVDADADNNANWISNIAITDDLNAMSPRHILVVADTCYSGTLTRSALARLDEGMNDENKAEWVKTMLKDRSRVALTSGGLKPVADGGPNGHSIFASAFIKALQNNNSLLEGQELYRIVSPQVIAAAEQLKIEQEPQYDPIQYAGHEAGDFFFKPK